MERPAAASKTQTAPLMREVAGADEPEWFRTLRRLCAAPPSLRGADGLRLQNAPAELARTRSAARKDGFPLTIEEWRGAPIPPSENAAYSYWTLARRLREKPLSDEFWTTVDQIHGRELPTEQLARLRETLEARTDLIGLIDRILHTPRCFYAFVLYPEPPGEPSIAGAPRLTGYIFRAASRLVVLRAQLAALDGRPEEALSRLKEGFRIGEHTASEPGLLGPIVSAASDQIMRRGLQWLVRHHQITADQALAALPGVDYVARYRRGLQGELVQHLRETEAWRRAGSVPTLGVMDLLSTVASREQGPPQWEELSVRSLSGSDTDRLWTLFWIGTQARVIRVVRALNEVAGFEPVARQAAYRRLKERVGRSDGLLGDGAEWVQNFDLKSVEELGREEGQDAAFRAAMPVVQFHARRGFYPDSLSETGERMPLDPFDGRAIRYRKERDGFTVYSVGPDGKYNGGEAAPVGAVRLRWVEPAR